MWPLPFSKSQRYGHSVSKTLTNENNAKQAVVSAKVEVQIKMSGNIKE